MDELPLDRALGQVLRDDGLFKHPVLIWIFEGLQDGFGREPVSQGIPARDMFAICARRPSAFERVEPIGLYLPGLAHERCGAASAVPGVAAFRVRRPARPAAAGRTFAGGVGKPAERVSFQSFRAMLTASMPTLAHHPASLPVR